jgi:hypothetical protein
MLVPKFHSRFNEWFDTLGSLDQNSDVGGLCWVVNRRQGTSLSVGRVRERVGWLVLDHALRSSDDSMKLPSHDRCPLRCQAALLQQHPRLITYVPMQVVDRTSLRLQIPSTNWLGESRCGQGQSCCGIKRRCMDRNRIGLGRGVWPSSSRLFQRQQSQLNEPSGDERQSVEASPTLAHLNLSRLMEWKRSVFTLTISMQSDTKSWAANFIS